MPIKTMKFSHLFEPLILSVQFFILPFNLFCINHFSCNRLLLFSRGAGETICFLVEKDNMKKIWQLMPWVFPRAEQC